MRSWYEPRWALLLLIVVSVGVVNAGAYKDAKRAYEQGQFDQAAHLLAKHLRSFFSPHNPDMLPGQTTALVSQRSPSFPRVIVLALVIGLAGATAIAECLDVDEVVTDEIILELQPGASISDGLRYSGMIAETTRSVEARSRARSGA